MENPEAKSSSPVASRGPLGENALTLSGGGYRAVAFHLGTLSMLKQLGLLEDVTRLSTISGGTIVGAKYALELSKGPEHDFINFEKEMRDFLAKTNVIAGAVERLNETISPNGKPLMPSLIRSAASVYGEAEFVGDSTLGELRRSKHGIGEVSFNSTDFFSGTRFRFQYNQRQYRIATGSSSIRVRRKVADEVRLADIIAASSCFPGGFEPLFFPADFKWTRPIEEIKSVLGDKFTTDIPLMDGGIIDNQGIDGIKTFLDRKDGGTNLFIISDSSPRSSKIYEGKSKTRSRWLAVTSLFFVSIFLHEFAHEVAAKMEKLEVVEIVLHPFGGLTRFRHEPETPRAEFRIAVAGPAAAASFIIAVVFVLLMAAANAAGLDILAILLFLLGLLNFLIAVFNMLPGYPLDGGRVLRFFGSLNKNRSFHCKSSKMFDIGTLSVANQILMNC